MHYAAMESDSIVVGSKRSLVRDIACLVPKHEEKIWRTRERTRERETRFVFRINYDMTRHRVFACGNQAYQCSTLIGLSKSTYTPLTISLHHLFNEQSSWKLAIYILFKAYTAENVTRDGRV